MLLTATAIAIVLCVSGAGLWWLRRRPSEKAPTVVICPKCFKAPAHTWSGKRKVCLVCAYEEIS